MSRGKVIEDNRFVSAVISQTSSSTTPLFNGVASGGTNGIDTQGCDEFVAIVNVGEITSPGTLDVDIYESDENDSSTATLIAGAVFTQFTDTNEDATYTGSVKCKNYKRYFFIHSVQSAHAITFAANGVLGKCDRDPQANSPVFDLNYAV